MMFVHITVVFIVLAINTNHFVYMYTTKPGIECNFCDRKFEDVAARNVHLETHRPRIKFEGTNNILVMRHSKRELCCGGTKYDVVLYDIPRIQRKKNITLRTRYDPPLTFEGYKKSKLFGEAMRFAGIKIKRVYSSPAFRCIQTCHGVLTGLGIVNEQPIRIETGLYQEIYDLRSCETDFFQTDDELLSAGYNIDVTYQPQMLREDLLKLKVMSPHIREWSTEMSPRMQDEGYYTLFYTRNHKALLRILKEDQEKDGKCILIVAHCPTVDTCSRILVGPRPENRKRRKCSDFPLPDPEVDYLGMIHLQKANSNWTLHNSPVPVPTIYGRFIYKPFNISELHELSQMDAVLKKYGAS